MADLFDVSVGGVGWHFTSHLIALAALFIACFAIAGYITFRTDSIPAKAVKDGYQFDDEDITAKSLTSNTTVLANEGLISNRSSSTTHGATKYIYGANSTANSNPFSTQSTAAHPYGTRLLDGDSEYVYGEVGAVALTAGTLLQSAAVVANHNNMVVTAAVAAGASIITVTLGPTAATANQYQDGYLYVNDQTGQGQTFRVKSHPAANASATCAFTIYGTVATALDATSELTAHVNPYSNLIIAPTTETGAVVGAAHVDIAANAFGWFKVKGPQAILTSGTLVLGHNCTRSDSTAGAVEPLDGTTAGEDVAIGTVMTVNATTEYSLIKLNIN